eukprot:5051195-Amphidinium_carterae.1
MHSTLGHPLPWWASSQQLERACAADTWAAWGLEEWPWAPTPSSCVAWEHGLHRAWAWRPWPPAPRATPAQGAAWPPPVPLQSAERQMGRRQLLPL